MFPLKMLDTRYTRRIDSFLISARVDVPAAEGSSESVDCVCVLSQREKAVRDMLTLHCPLQETDESVHRERFLTERLLVPELWLHEAKATRARHDADRHQEALHLYRAGYWNQCHQLLIQHLASGAGSAVSFPPEFLRARKISPFFSFACF